MIEELVLLSRAIVTKLNSILLWEAEARVNFMEVFIKTVCAKELPTIDSKQSLLDKAAMWDTACRAVASKHYTAKEAIEINLLLDWIADIMVQISSMKCGGG